MRYIYSCQTDVGAVRENNQDSLVVKSLNLGKHMVVFAAVCDGVGGLSHGERASRTSVEMLSSWFDYELPQILEQSPAEPVLRYRFRQLLSEINREIYNGNLRSGVSSATTLTALLLWDYHYLAGHVGDSRIYKIDYDVQQLTRDHSWVAQEVAMGRMTAHQAAIDTRQNIILKCMGAEPEVEPDVFEGRIREKTVFVLCTDGFWHHVDAREWIRQFSPAVIKEEKHLAENLYFMAEQVKQRGESDNITAIAIDVF
ncbi:MAG: serine/threonine-protein phosphatase [Lachnospiraceae bacterium]|nr:serine/threonine-protein phosphatase [Lachnospiraceae bacterium]